MADEDRIVPLFTQEQIEFLRDMFETYGRRQLNRQIKDRTPQLATTPDIYIAIPTGATGIPGLSGVGSAADSPQDGDIPGVADCDIFRIVNGVLTAQGFAKRVYNVAFDNIGTEWTFVLRDKYGSWVAMPNSRAVLGKALYSSIYGTSIPFYTSLAATPKGSETPNSDVVYAYIRQGIVQKGHTYLLVPACPSQFGGQTVIYEIANPDITFLAVAAVHIYEGSNGNCTVITGSGGSEVDLTISVQAQFGDINHGAYVLVNWGAAIQEGISSSSYLGVQIACPTGTGT